MQDHFHQHPSGRLHEFGFWSGIGVVMGILAFIGWQTTFLSPPIAMLLGIVAVCFVGWAFLPQGVHKTASPPKPTKSRRR